MRITLIVFCNRLCDYIYWVTFINKTKESFSKSVKPEFTPTIAHFFFVYVLKRRLRIRFNREWSTKNMGSSRSSILCFLMLCASFLVPTSCHSYSHGALFIFGDSFYDAGNNIYLNTSNTSLAKLNIFPYGETYFKHPTGRVSDGRLIPDFIVKYNTWQFFFSLFLISALFFLFWNRLLDIYILNFHITD